MTVGRLAEQIADEAMALGGEAVVLVGSWARGDPGPRSDVDITVLGAEQPGRLEWREGQLVSVAFRSADTIRADFLDPAIAGVAVPTWVSARILADPNGIAAALRRDSHGWSWDQIGDERLNAWVAESVSGYAEDVLKLRSAIERGDPILAGVMRSVLAVRLAPILAVHRRLLFASEDDTWSGLDLHLGEAWAAAQERSLDGSADAAIVLFRFAVAEIWQVLDERQRRVVEGALGQVT